MKQPTGLAAFTKKGKTATEQAQPVITQPVQPVHATPQTNQRRRGKKPLVSLTLRLKRSDWERVHQLAVAEGYSIQKLAFDGLSKMFEERGLPPLDDSTS